MKSRPNKIVILFLVLIFLYAGSGHTQNTLDHKIQNVPDLQAVFQSPPGSIFNKPDEKTGWKENWIGFTGEASMLVNAGHIISG